jgi:hypothetical protein
MSLGGAASYKARLMTRRVRGANRCQAKSLKTPDGTRAIIDSPAKFQGLINLWREMDDLLIEVAKEQAPWIGQTRSLTGRSALPIESDSVKELAFEGCPIADVTNRRVESKPVISSGSQSLREYVQRLWAEMRIPPQHLPVFVAGH